LDRYQQAKGWMPGRSPCRDSLQLILNKEVNSQSPKEEYPRTIFWTKIGTNCERAVARHSRIGNALVSLTPGGDRLRLVNVQDMASKSRSEAACSEMRKRVGVKLGYLLMR
jgi:hypothetical protein